MTTSHSNHPCPKCGAPIPNDAPQSLCPRCVLGAVVLGPETVTGSASIGNVPSTARVAAAFPDLEILELIGRGGMGFVFKARQPRLDRYVALKLLPDTLAQDPRFTERFNREGRVLAKLSHPNIVTVFDFGRAGDFYYLTMEYMDGVNLRQAMQAGRFSPSEALAVIPKICDALQYAHEQGVLHRDIKPENILIDAKGRVKIADFGIAKLIDEDPKSVTLTGTGSALGTPHYMAPEQLEKPTAVDHRADIYSLGVVLYEMLTGELPLGRFGPPSAKTPVSASVDELVFRTLERDREKRFQSAGAVKNEVEHLTASGGCIAVSRQLDSEGARSGPTSSAAGVTPEWRTPVGILFVVLGALAGISNLIALTSHRVELNLFMLISLTGIALLTGNRTVRKVAIVINCIGLLLPWLSAFQVALAVRNGVFEVLDGSPALSGGTIVRSLMFAFLEMSAYAGALLALLQRDAKAWFLSKAAARERHKEPKRETSFRALAGAGLVSLSLMVPLIQAIGNVDGRIGFRSTDFFQSLGSIAIVAVGGTLVGWLGLNDVREHRGEVRGLWPALFATLMWPLLILVGVPAVVVPVMVLQNAHASSAAAVAGKLILLIVPVAVVTFALWIIYSTARWAMNRSATQKRGVLKWIFAALLIALYGVVLVSREQLSSPGRAPAPTKDLGASVAPRTDPSESIMLKMRAAKLQAVTFELYRHDTQPPTPVPSASGFMLTSRGSGGEPECTVELVRQGQATPFWILRLSSDDGHVAFSDALSLGTLLPDPLLVDGNLFGVLPGCSIEIPITRVSDSLPTSGATPTTPLTLRVHSTSYSVPDRFDRTESTVGIGTTNWMEMLRAGAPKVAPAIQSIPAESLP